MRRWWSVLPIAAGALMIMGVVWLNGNPAVFTDTDDYFVEGQTFAYTIGYALHLKTPPPPPTDPDDIADAKQAAEDLKMSHTEIGARSPYYGLFLYASQRIGTIWLTAALQALVGAWLAFVFWRAAAPRARWWTAYLTEATVALASTLPFFAGFTMPDVFSGYCALSAVLILAFWERLKAPVRIALAVLLGFSMTFHTSHLLTRAALLAMGAALMRWLKAPRMAAAASLLTVTAAILGAVLATGIYKEAVKLKTGDELRRPPFLAMRVLADGPGRNYLRSACDRGAHYVLCQFRNLPLDNSQDLLWSDDRKKGIFNVTTVENRLRMEREETRFVLNAVAYDPLGQVLAALGNWGQQLGMIYVDDPLKNPHYYLTNDYWSTTNLPWLINQARDCGRDHWGCGPHMSIEGSTWVHGGLTLVSLLLILGRLSQRDIRLAVRRRELPWDDERTRLAVALVLLVAAVLINGFVCGALSGPFPRYQARITWLLQAGAALSAITLLPQRLPVALLAWLARLRSYGPVQALERRIDPAFLRFGLVGAVGFTVDYVVLHVLVGLAGVSPYWGRFISFPVAVLVTWTLNKSFTFRHHGRPRNPLRQALAYAAVQGAGGAANIVAYSLVLSLAPGLRHALFVPLAFGSAAGLCLTFAGSKRFAFKPAPAVGAATVPAGRRIG